MEETEAREATPPARPAFNLRARLRQGIAWNFISVFFNQGSTFIAAILLARLLGRQQFGEFAVVQGTVVTLANIAALATGSTATKYVAEFRSTDPEKAGRILGLCEAVSTGMALLVALVLLIGAPWLTDVTLNAPHLAPALRVGAGTLFFATLIGFQTGALAGLEGYRLLAPAGVVGGLLYVLFAVGFAWRWGVAGGIGGILAANALQWLLLRRLTRIECARHGIAFRRQSLLRERRVILHFALPAALSGFISLPTLWLSQAILARQPDGLTQIALYSAAFNLMSLVRFLPAITNNVGASLLNHQKGVHDARRYAKMFWSNIVMSGTVALAGGVGVYLLGPLLLRLYGEDFQAAYPALGVLLIAVVIEALAIATYQVIQSREKMWISFFGILIPYCLCFILASHTLSPRYGAVGLATAYALGWLVNWIASGLFAWRIGLGLPAPAVPEASFPQSGVSGDESPRSLLRGAE